MLQSDFMSITELRQACLTFVNQMLAKNYSLFIPLRFR